MLNRLSRFIPVIFVLVVLAACSTPPKPAPAPAQSGDQMLRESEGIARMGQRWLDGKKKVEEGEEMIRKGQATIDSGQRLVGEGRRIMQESEAGYQGLRK
ncbi:MAG: hypothetical protein FIA97_09665 [Methylococcaceae bacterium]|nr:hypothetical protein [Methylococcaceae bacterium]